MASGIFNIRVYGILLNEALQVLLSDEFRFGCLMTKFPGGGLVFGEGMLDCLRREFREELSQEIVSAEHFYTTDFFQQSAFHDDQQLISVYYRVEVADAAAIKASATRYGFEEKKEGAQAFRWAPLSALVAGELTFPVDLKVGEMLRKAV